MMDGYGYGYESLADEIARAIEALSKGSMVIVADDDDREAEGDFVAAAELIDAEAVNGMVTRGRGLLCCAIDPSGADRLGLRPRSGGPHDTAFTESLDVKAGTSTGISCADRAATLRAIADPLSSAADFHSPGHVFPLVARPGGTIERRGHTEASIDLCRIAGLRPAAAICEIMADDGTMMRGPALRRLSERMGVPFLAVDRIAAYRKAHEALVEPTARASLPTEYGDFTLHHLRSPGSTLPILALSYGLPPPSADGFSSTDPERSGMLVRVHSECATGDLFGSLRCDCGAQLRESMRRVARAGRGLIVYLRQEGRGIGLEAKLSAYGLQDGGLDTVDANLKLGFPADARDYWEAAQVIRLFACDDVRLLTNNPNKVETLRRYGVSVRERLGLLVGSTDHSERYLLTKRDRMGHAI
jgi:3,4-dihydroxy 2-butanone 4-phosphate synthase/GTP cyclohydrolase II